MVWFVSSGEESESSGFVVLPLGIGFLVVEASSSDALLLGCKNKAKKNA